MARGYGKAGEKCEEQPSDYQWSKLEREPEIQKAARDHYDAERKVREPSQYS